MSGSAFSPEFVPGQARPNGAALRVSDAEREQVVVMLQQAFSEGRLDNSELDERIESAFAAKTQGDLAVVLRGLPVGGTPFAPRAAPAPAYAGRPGVAPTALERSWAMAAHWLGVFAFCLGPIVIARTKGKLSPYIREQAIEAANFQLTALGAYIALGIVTGVTFGIAGVFFPILGVLWLALTGIAGLSAAAGNTFRYPWSLRLISR